MTGSELKSLRVDKAKLTQSKFYLDAGVFSSYGSQIENYWGTKEIPPKLEAAIRKKYAKFIEPKP
jgi:tmRNA-binding protein